MSSGFRSDQSLSKVTEQDNLSCLIQEMEREFYYDFTSETDSNLGRFITSFPHNF